MISVFVTITQFTAFSAADTGYSESPRSSLPPVGTRTILPESDSRICPYAIRSIHHAFLTGLRFESQWRTHVERDELAGVSRNSLDGSATLGIVSPHQVLLLVRISRRNPICLTCEPASPGIAPMLFSRNGCAITLIQDSSFDSCKRASSSMGKN